MVRGLCVCGGDEGGPKAPKTPTSQYDMLGGTMAYPEEPHSRSAKVPGPTRTNTSVSLWNMTEARTRISGYMRFYNGERPHQALGKPDAAGGVRGWKCQHQSQRPKRTRKEGG